jgi:hypothetical protein
MHLVGPIILIYYGAGQENIKFIYIYKFFNKKIITFKNNYKNLKRICNG